MDRIDKKILGLIQEDARLTTAEIADKVGLSASPCARRIKRLEQDGIIAGYHAYLVREKGGYCHDGVCRGESQQSSSNVN